METFWSAFVGCGVAMALFTFWVKSYFSPYLSKKGENLATHEDIYKLVDQVRETERVKAEITDRTWDRQMRWNFKRDMYIRLMEALAERADVESYNKLLEQIHRREPKNELYPEERNKALLRSQEVQAR